MNDRLERIVYYFGIASTAALVFILPIGVVLSLFYDGQISNVPLFVGLAPIILYYVSALVYFAYSILHKIFTEPKEFFINLAKIILYLVVGSIIMLAICLFLIALFDIGE